MSEEEKTKSGNRRRTGGKKSGPRAESAPVPDSMKGSAQTGHIDEVVKTKYGGPPRFGFIFIGSAPPAGETEKRPRIYFNLTDYKTEEFRARRGYEVGFTVDKDDQDRFFAKDVTLTSAGKATAAEREAAIEKRGNTGAGEGGDKPKKERRKRAIDTTEVKLKLTAAGIYDGDVEVVAKLGESLGKLKHTCITAVGTEDISLNVFNAAGTLLSKELLREMKDGDAITLKKLPDATA